MERAELWARARRILCVRLDGMGDVLMTTPALRALREAHGGARELTLLASPAGSALLDLLPDVDDVIAHPVAWMKSSDRADPAAHRRLLDEVRRRRFDAAVIFSVCTQSALPAAMLCYLAEIPLRLAHCRENPYQLLTDWVPDAEGDGALRHEVRRQLDLVAEIGAKPDGEALSVRIPARGFEEAAAALAGAGVGEGGRAERVLDRASFIVIHAGATAPSRRYRPAGFAEAAAELARRGHRIVFTGSVADRPLIDAIRSQAGAPTWSLAGRLSTAGLAATLSLADVLISNNTGPVHLAAAVGTPVVDLYALTNLQHTPWMVPSRVLYRDVPCKGCLRSVCPLGHHACLALVAPSAIVRAATELLDGAVVAPARTVPSRSVSSDPSRERHAESSPARP
jgi:lipopolysaccharide heptosyltransferase II